MRIHLRSVLVSSVVVIMIFLFPASISAAPLQITVDGTTHSLKRTPIKRNDIVYHSLLDLVELFRLSYAISNDNIFTVIDADTSVSFKSGVTGYSVNLEPVETKSTPFKVLGKFYVNLEDFAQGLGYLYISGNSINIFSNKTLYRMPIEIESALPEIILTRLNSERTVNPLLIDTSLTEEVISPSGSANIITVKVYINEGGCFSVSPAGESVYDELANITYNALRDNVEFYSQLISTNSSRINCTLNYSANCYSIIVTID